MDSQELLRSAVSAARSGQRQPARALFLQLIEQDPGCELAWLWLSDLHDDLDARMLALEKALLIRPNNSAARARLEQLRAESVAACARPAAMPALAGQIGGESQQPFTSYDISLDEPAGAGAGWRNPQPAGDPQDAFRQAKRLAKEGNRDAALGLLVQLVEVHPRRANAWLLIAQLSPRASEQIAALKQVVTLQPDNHEARASLQRLEKLERHPFLLGEQHEERGEREQASAVYRWIAVHSRSATDRLEANRRISNLNLLQEAEHLHRVDPTLNLLRLTLGPAIFFGLLIFFQSGLNPLKMSFFSLLGEVSVLTGSLLVNVTGLRPMHPRWVQQFGQPGSTGELEMRFGLRLLGWALLIAPHLLFLIEALNRLAQFYANLDY